MAYSDQTRAATKLKCMERTVFVEHPISQEQLCSGTKTTTTTTTNTTTTTIKHGRKTIVCLTELELSTEDLKINCHM